MKTPVTTPPKPAPPCWIGSVPSVNAIGRVTGAKTRSYGRTQSAAATLTSRKKTPYALCTPPRSSWSRKANASSASVASSQQPSPVSLADGILAGVAADGTGTGPRCPRAR
nr:hypothetical protein [Streptomyces lydicus]